MADPGLRENFLERVFAYQRVREVFSGHWRREAVEAFHQREKHLLLTHNPQHYDDLCRLVNDLPDFRPAAFSEQYLAIYMAALSGKTTMSRHLDSLQDITSHLRGKLSPEEQRRLIKAIEDFRGGRIPLIEPVTLLRSYFETYKVPDMGDQSYLNPYPPELMVRLHD